MHVCICLYISICVNIIMCMCGGGTAASGCRGGTSDYLLSICSILASQARHSLEKKEKALVSPDPCSFRAAEQGSLTLSDSPSDHPIQIHPVREESKVLVEVPSFTDTFGVQMKTLSPKHRGQN